MCDAQLVGREYQVRLHYSVQYDPTVKAGVEEQQAVEEADLRRFANDLDPTDRDLVHSDVETLRDIFADDPDACDVADWIDAPSAPSEETYWDDSRHFGTEATEDKP